MNLPWLLINLFSNNNWIVTCNYKLNHVVILLFSNSNEYHESSNIQGIIESFTQEQNSAVSPVNDELTQDNINPAFNDSQRLMTMSLVHCLPQLSHPNLKTGC